MAYYKGLVRRDFGRAAVSYDRHSDLQRRVATEVATRYIAWTSSKVMDRVLDMGCGTGAVGESLARGVALPSLLVQLDLAHPMTQRAIRPERPGVTADGERLPFAAESFDAVLSSLSLQWLNDLTGTLQEIYRVLKPKGLLVASTLVQGSLAELAQTLRSLDGSQASPTMLPLLDRASVQSSLHRSKLVEGHFQVRSETVRFSEPYELLRGLKGLGASAKSPPTVKGLHGRHRLAEICRRYREVTGVPEGPVPVSWYVAYFVAWRP